MRIYQTSPNCARHKKLILGVHRAPITALSVLDAVKVIPARQTSESNVGRNLAAGIGEAVGGIEDHSGCGAEFGSRLRNQASRIHSA